MMDEKGKILLPAFELGARILSENSNKKQKMERTNCPLLFYLCRFTNIK